MGTSDHTATEVFSQNGYGEEADWWPIGVILFEIVVRYSPFFSEIRVVRVKNFKIERIFFYPD